MFAKNVRFLRKKKGLSQRELAKQVGLSNTAISKWEKDGNIPSMSTLVKLVELFDVESVMALLDEDLSKGKIATTDNQYVSIPVYAFVHAGIPHEMIEDSIVDFEDIPKRLTRGGKEYFGLIIRGDSMYPRYEDGDIIIVRKQETFTDGDDCIVRVDVDNAVLRKVRQQGNNVILQPFNQNYSPTIFTGSPNEPSLNIIGVVVELRRRMQ